MNSPQQTSWVYKDFLQSFQQNGYEFVFFQGLDKSHGQVALRHDIDFDTAFAVQSARIEHQLGIKATYFFLMRSEFYNIFSAEDYKNIVEIKALGHKISIHFDPTLYENFHEGLEKEVKVFNAIFDEHVDFISLHRPNDFFLNFDEPILGINHTYQTKYFRDLKYFADSTGIWRFGNPVDSEEFRIKRTLHVLIHPVWWMVEGTDNLDKLKTYFRNRVKQINQQFYLNCIPFRQIHDQI